MNSCANGYPEEHIGEYFFGDLESFTRRFSPNLFPSFLGYRHSSIMHRRFPDKISDIFFELQFSENKTSDHSENYPRNGINERYFESKNPE
jgi:hypothetical protein